MKPYHVIVNPNAGFLRSGRLDPNEPARILGNSECVTVTRDLDHLKEVVQRLSSSGVQTVAVLGGDGTLLRTFNEFASVAPAAELPTFFPLGGGTTNALQAELKLPASPVPRIERLKAVLGGAPPTSTERNTLRVNGHLGFTFGAGYLRNVCEFYESHEVGKWTAAVVTWKITKGLLLGDPAILRFLDNVPASIQFDDTEVPFDGFNFGYLSTISENGLNMKITPAASGAAEQFEALIADVTPGELLRTSVKMSLGAVMSAPRQHRSLVRTVQFEAAEPIPWFMDGELFEPAKTILVELGPRLRVQT